MQILSLASTNPIVTKEINKDIGKKREKKSPQYREEGFVDYTPFGDIPIGPEDTLNST